MASNEENKLIKGLRFLKLIAEMGIADDDVPSVLATSRQPTKENAAMLIQKALDSGLREDFCRAFDFYLDVTGMTDNEISKILQISRPTVNRWRTAQSAPHPIGQKATLEYLLKSLEEQ